MGLYESPKSDGKLSNENSTVFHVSYSLLWKSEQAGRGRRAYMACRQIMYCSPKDGATCERYI